MASVSAAPAGRLVESLRRPHADDIAVGPKGELAWTNYLMRMLRYRQSDDAPMRVRAKAA